MPLLISTYVLRLEHIQYNKNECASLWKMDDHRARRLDLHWSCASFVANDERQKSIRKRNLDVGDEDESERMDRRESISRQSLLISFCRNRLTDRPNCVAHPISTTKSSNKFSRCVILSILPLTSLTLLISNLHNKRTEPPWTPLLLQRKERNGNKSARRSPHVMRQLLVVRARR
jgi:hypothetical protein